MSNQQSSKGPSLIGQTIGPTAPVVAGEDNSGLVKPLQVDASGKLLVSVTGAGSGGTSEVDQATFTAGVSAGTPAMGVYQATPSALSDGQEGIIALDANRNVKVNIVAGSSGNSAASATGAAVPADADYIGFNDPSGNLTGLASENLDYDTGGGTQPQTIIGIALPASGGPVAGGTATNPIRTDPTGTTDQPITAAALPLPTGAATESTLSTLNGKVTACNTGAVVVSSGSITATQGTATNLKAQAEAYQGGTAVGAANPLQVSLANTGANATAVKVDGTGGSFPVSGTVATTQSTSPWIVAGGGTAGSAAAGVATIQGIASMTPVQVSQATATNLKAEVVGTGTFAAQVTAVGTIADDATTPGAPVMVGGTAKLFDGTDPGNVSAEDDVTRAITDTQRRLYVNDVHPAFWSFHLDTSTAQTDTSVHAAPSANYAIFVTDIVFSTGAATACNIFFEEGSTTVLGPYYLEAVAGRGLCIQFKTPKMITAATALTVTTSASIAQALDVSGFIAKVS